ncbi:MAG TPA: TfpX/TfpZ family type IV pilin accessory protein [Casimicrobiaceae bacterium]|nr:TfpX/TfpZ family type IV pilin accessory protein [Casimicrobiaceae bacterium]
MITLESLDRWKAAAIHLGLSALIALTVVAVMLALWYPQPYFDAMGGKGLLKILVGVDVTIGPLLTLIIFDRRKKSLRFDLAVIALLQLAALVYGVYVMFEARPVYAVFVMDRFEMVSADQLDPADLAAGPPEYRALPLTGTKLVGTKLPDKSNPEEWNKLVFSSVGGKDAQNFPRYYVPYAEAVPAILAKARPLSALLEGHPEREPAVRAAVAKSGQAESALAFVPLMGREGAMTALLDRRDARLVAVLSIDPY